MKRISKVLRSNAAGILSPLALGAALALVPTTSDAEVLMLVCQGVEGRSLPQTALVMFKVDLDRNTVEYVHEDGATVLWVVPAVITAGYIRWNGYATKWSPTPPKDGPDGPAQGIPPRPIEDRSNGRFDPGPTLQGTIDRTSGRVALAIALWFPSPGRYRVDTLTGSCRRGTQKF